jgi:hypothetical protein
MQSPRNNILNCKYALASDACFLHIAVSVRDLKKQVLQRLNQSHLDGLDAAGIKIPMDSWMAFQFSPKHPLHVAIIHGHFKLSTKCKLELSALIIRTPTTLRVFSR